MAKQVLIPNGGFLVAKSAYDQVVTIGVNTSAPVTITLPGGETYEDDELWVELRGQLLRPIQDYVFVGAAPRTQIQVLQDLEAGDTIRIKKIS